MRREYIALLLMVAASHAWSCQGDRSSAFLGAPPAPRLGVVIRPSSPLRVGSPAPAWLQDSKHGSMFGSRSPFQRARSIIRASDVPIIEGPLDPPKPRTVNWRAIMVLLFGELSVGAVAFPVGLLFKIAPLATLMAGPTLTMLKTAVLLTLPLLICHFVSGRRIEQMLKEGLKDVFGDSPSVPLVLALSIVLSAAAGIGEEIFFRGTLQPLISSYLGPVVGIGASSIFFGTLHAATPRYAILATGLSVYLGIVQYKYSCLLVPIVIHTLFDIVGFLRATLFVSLLPLVRRVKNRRR